MRFPDRQVLFVVIGLVFTASSTASPAVDNSSNGPRQEKNLQLVRRFYHGCESLLIVV